MSFKKRLLEDMGLKRSALANFIGTSQSARVLARLFSAYRIGSCRLHSPVGDLEIGLADSHFASFE